MCHKAWNLALFSVFSFPSHAAELAVESLTITGGSFAIFSPNPGILGCGSTFGWACISPGPAAHIDDDIANDGLMVTDGLWGSPSTPVLSAIILNKPVLGFFAHSAGAGTPVDPDPDSLTATVNITTGSVSADFSGFFYQWDGMNAYAGGIASGHAELLSITATGARHYAFQISWNAPAYGSVFSAPATYVNLTGTLVTAVPEAEKYTYILVGLGLIGFISRRHQFTAEGIQKSRGTRPGLNAKSSAFRTS